MVAAIIFLLYYDNNSALYPIENRARDVYAHINIFVRFVLRVFVQMSERRNKIYRNVFFARLKNDNPRRYVKKCYYSRLWIRIRRHNSLL